MVSERRYTKEKRIMQKKKITIKQIFQENFQGFWINNREKYPEALRDHIYDEVKKMLGCGDKAVGFVSYICVICQEIIKIGFTCKSRFCSKCGKKYVSQWVEKQVEKIMDVPHRHCIFTLPEEFRGYFFWNREGLKDLQNMVHEVLTEYANGVNKGNREEYNKVKKRKKGGEIWQVGMIGVVHTFGSAIGFNPHVHALVPEIKIKGNKVEKMSYLDYTYLRRVWQYKLINYMVTKKPSKRKEYLGMFKAKADGFYVNARSRMKSAKGAARYIGRYLARPAIAEYRITGYTGKEVTFWYKSHDTKEKVIETLKVEAFIGKLLMHIPPKHFKMVRTYGIYSSRKHIKIKQSNGIIQNIESGYKSVQYTIEEYMQKQKVKKLTYRELMIRNFSKDPYQCGNCGQIMELWEIWKKGYGYIYELGKV